jgi:hypothetical protein
MDLIADIKNTEYAKNGNQDSNSHAASSTTITWISI